MKIQISTSASGGLQKVLDAISWPFIQKGKPRPNPGGKNATLPGHPGSGSSTSTFKMLKTSGVKLGKEVGETSGYSIFAATVKGLPFVLTVDEDGAALIALTQKDLSGGEGGESKEPTYRSHKKANAGPLSRLAEIMKDYIGEVNEEEDFEIVMDEKERAEDFILYLKNVME